MSKNRVIGGLEEAFEKGQGAVIAGVKQTAKDFTASAKGQITGGSTTASSSSSHQQPSHGASDHGTNEHGANPQQHSDPAATQKSDQERVDFLRDLYGGKSHGDKKDAPHSDSSKTDMVKQALGLPQSDPNKGKSPEEVAKLAALRNQLHANYYQELTTPKQKEVTVTEKLEREEQIERMDAFEKDKKKPKPINPTMKQGTAESVVGVSG